METIIAAGILLFAIGCLLGKPVKIEITHNIPHSELVPVKEPEIDAPEDREPAQAFQEDWAGVMFDE